MVRQGRQAQRRHRQGVLWGVTRKNFRFRLLKGADLSAVFFHGQGIYRNLQKQSRQNGIFAICSLRMLLGHYKRKLQYLQTVQIYHKDLPRLSGIIRVHSGRTERTSPITSERFSPQMPMQAHFPAGAAAAAAHSRPIKNCLPFLCEAIARAADRLPNPS